ncbi:MAG: tetratricopeptide repeat protein, partial [Thermoanaerobaculia bacterium]|nr:tetratricopeptide repeat protein [Thermoanaerobaculia bacterium]
MPRPFVATLVFLWSVALLPVSGAFAQEKESGADPSAAMDLLESKILLGEGQYRKALKRLRDAVEKEPDDPYLRLELARLSARLGRIEEAAGHAERVWEGFPEDPDVLFVLGEVFQRLATRAPEYGERARGALEKVLEIEPGNVEALHSLGRLYQRQGNLEGAEESFRRLMDLQPGERTATFLLQILLERDETAEARQLLREVLEHDPGVLEMRFTLADLLAEAGRREAALEILEAAPGDQGREPELVRRIVGLLLQEDRTEEARERLETAIRENPGADRLKVYLGLLLADLGEVGDARELLTRHLESHPRDLEAARALIRLEVEAERPREALRVARRVTDAVGAEDPESVGELVRTSMELMARAGRWDLAAEAASLIPEGAPEGVRLQALRLEIEG